MCLETDTGLEIYLVWVQTENWNGEKNIELGEMFEVVELIKQLPNLSSDHHFELGLW